MNNKNKKSDSIVGKIIGFSIFGLLFQVLFCIMYAVVFAFFIWIIVSYLSCG